MNDVPLLDVAELSVEFRTRLGTVKALERVDLNLDRGEIIAVVGESGSGKSVTAYSIMGILDAAAHLTAGRIMFGGLDLLQVPEAELANIRGRELAMIFQNPRGALNPIRQVGRQIGDILRRHAPIPRADVRHRAIDLLAQVRIPDAERRYEAYPFELSGGMCQRVGIAMALACEPALLIADEPTTGLDVTTQAAIMDLIVELAHKRRMATLLITHDLGLAAEYCEHIVVMHAGHVVESASVSELFAKPRHPYTAKLIASTPHGAGQLDSLTPIPGGLPDLRGDLPPCRYRGRCERYTPLCDQAPLPRLHIDPRHVVACRVSAMTALLEVERLSKFFPLGGHSLVARMVQAMRRRDSGADGLSERALLHAVDDVSITIEAGESVGLVGESGCGKSTLARVIARLIDPTSGKIRFQGRDLVELPAHRFARTPERRLIQQVFQDATESLNPRFTAAHSIADPLQRLVRLRGADLWTRVGELADLVNLPRELLERYPHQLSGGQKARVGIARALAANPRLLILDEPTSALDVSVQAVILKLLADLRRQLGMSFLFISHDLNVVRLMCDRVLVMYLGKIIEAGPAWQVFEQPQHPYTQALVSAIPTIETRARQGRIRLDGEPVSPIDPDPHMCRFYGRCPRQAKRCRIQMPQLTPVLEAQLTACHFPASLSTGKNDGLEDHQAGNSDMQP